MADFVLLSCEHGGNRVPAEYARLFRGRRRLLESHRGYDPGALELARTCAAGLSAPLRFSTVTRLLVELNRSPGHPALFSEVTACMPPGEREAIERAYYRPYREAVEVDVRDAVKRGCRVVHLSLHSCAPVLHGEVRRMDVGLLYDPARPGERRFCDELKRSLGRMRPALRVRRNYPYLGKSDGLTSALRKNWPAASYVGVEIEVNQRWPRGPRDAWRSLQRDIARALVDLLTHGRASKPAGVRQSASPERIFK